MNTKDKDALDQQLFDSLHTFESTPNDKLFESMQTQRSNKKRKMVFAWFWLLPVAAASILAISYWFRVEPTIAPQKQVRKEVTEKLTLKTPKKKIPSQEQQHKNSIINSNNFTRKSLAQTEKKEHRNIKKLTPSKALNEPMNSLEDKGQQALPIVENVNPPAFNSTGFSNLFNDSLSLADTIRASVCENIEIPVDKLGLINVQGDKPNKQWWLAANYLQLFGKGVLSNNEESFLQITDKPSSNAAQAAYGLNLLLGKRIYRNFWFWTGLQYQRTIFTDMRLYTDYTEGSISASGDEMFYHKQYFDLNYTTATLPLGITYLKQMNKWQLKMDVAAQFNYLLATSSMRYDPVSKAIESPINAANQDRFNRNMFGLTSTASAGYNIRKNLWMNAGLGAIGYRRSYLNPSVYNKKPSANFVIQMGLQYYF